MQSKLALNSLLHAEPAWKSQPLSCFILPRLSFGQISSQMRACPAEAMGTLELACEAPQSS